MVLVFHLYILKFFQVFQQAYRFVLCVVGRDGDVLGNFEFFTTNLVSKYSKSRHRSLFPPPTQKQSDKPAETPENTLICIDEASIPPTLQTKNNKPSDP